MPRPAAGHRRPPDQRRARCLPSAPRRRPAATHEQLARVHGDGYIATIEAESPASGLHYIDPDTAMSPQSLTAARHAAGARRARDRPRHGRRSARRAFCAVRPPGHHAERNRAMGFCLFNNVAVGAAHALAAHGLERVAIVDFDVHHGNGTEDIFAGDPRVLMVSTFQHPLYPYSGVEEPAPNMVNIPLAAGSGGEEFRAAVREHWLPALEAPSAARCIFVSAGFDAHREDPLAGLKLVEADYAWVTRELVARRARACERPHRLDARRRLRPVRARAQRRRAHPRASRRRLTSTCSRRNGSGCASSRSTTPASSSRSSTIPISFATSPIAACARRRRPGATFWMGRSRAIGRHGFGLHLVELKATRTPIGICGLIKRDVLDDVDIGFAFLAPYRAAGFALEAARATMAFARTLGLARVVAIVAPHNADSIKLLGRLGFGYERSIRLADDAEELWLFASAP